MRLFLSLLFILSSSLAYSQAITITNSDFPAAGDTFHIATASITGTGIDLTKTDTNYTWDFSKLQHIGNVTDTFFSMTNSALLIYNLTGFLGASYATHTSSGFTVSTISFTNVFNMFSLSSKVLTNLGYAATVSGLPLPFKNNPKDTVYRFPVQYGNVDSCKSSASASIPTIGYFSQHQTRYNIVDGWGTVITPMASYSCLRVKTTIVAQDSVYINTLNFGLKLPATTTYQYKWLSHSFKEPVVEIDATGVGGKPTISAIRYRGAGPWGLGVQNVMPSTNVSMYPVPADKQVNVSADKRMVMAIYDITGRMVWQGNLLQQPVNINTEQWPAGLYIAHLSYNGVDMSKSFTVTH